ncbi:MAG: hypothetical protein M3291_07670, partial [Actinomycetota bacterium]|nr:hypothetical protein [Actinomycetota bacterium]
ETLSGTETVAFPWHTLLGFIRLTTRPTVMAPSLRTSDALDYVPLSTRTTRTCRFPGLRWADPIPPR